MKRKQIILLATVLGLLTIAVVVKQSRRPPELATEEYTPLDLSFDPSKVEKMEIGKGEGDNKTDKKVLPFMLVKDEKGDWRIPDFLNTRADTGKIDSLLKEIREAKGELRAKDQSLFPDFEIDEKKAFRISLLGTDGTPLQTLFIGNKSAGDNRLFVRGRDSGNVYATSANVLGLMGIYGKPAEEKPKADYWAATDLVKLEVDKIERLETVRFQGAKEQATAGLMRFSEPADSTRKKWKYLRDRVPFAPDAEKVRQFLNLMGSLRAAKAVDPAAEDYGFANPLWRMRVGLEGQKEITLTASPLNLETRAYFVQVSSEPVVFQLPDYSFRNLDIDDSKFFIDNPLAVEPEETDKLMIRRGKEKMEFLPKEKKSDALTSYLNGLKTFSVVRLLFDPSEQRKVNSSSPNRLEIYQEGNPAQVLMVGDLIPGTEKQFAAQWGDGTQPFALSESIFKKLFESLGPTD